MTTKQDIEQWFKQGVEEKATHMIVVCDTFDYEDYPSYVYEGQDVHKAVEAKRSASMQTVMEVYNLRMDMNTQLNQHRSFNY